MSASGKVAGLEDGVALQQLEVALAAVVQAIRSKLANEL